MSALKMQPPYSRELALARRQGESLNVFIHAGKESWVRARKRRPPNVLCLPPDAHFRQFDWQAVSGLELTLVYVTEDRSKLIEFGRELILSGARLVVGVRYGRCIDAIHFIPKYEDRLSNQV